MKDQDNIIAYGSFENSMEASLAKAKLDAYGIPCFLTEENLASLYPIQNPRFSVRLHIFQKDEAQVREVLTETVFLTEEELTRCPRCKSTHVEMGYTKKLTSRVVSILLSIILAIFPPKKVYHCLDCDHEF